MSPDINYNDLPLNLEILDKKVFKGTPKERALLMDEIVKGIIRDGYEDGEIIQYVMKHFDQSISINRINKLRKIITKEQHLTHYWLEGIVGPHAQTNDLVSEFKKFLKMYNGKPVRVRISIQEIYSQDIDRGLNREYSKEFFKKYPVKK